MNHKRLNFLPGPVDVPDKVREAFSGTPISHRSPEFLDTLKSVKEKLRSMTGALGVEVLMGSGTLANDAAAAQLSLLEGRGLIVTNGEFGERLLDHAQRFSLNFESLNYSWGSALDYGQIRKALNNNPNIKWLWAVHSETSTGVLNDIDHLRAVCADNGALLALDCVSSIGTVPLELSGVYIATGVSGKGLMSYPGLAMVFHNSNIMPTRGDIPRYLDLYQYSRSESVPFTVSSNLVSALNAALETVEYKQRYQRIKQLSFWLRDSLTRAGFKVISAIENAAPSVVTIALPEYINSRQFGETLEAEGYFIHHRSGYLELHNWIQIALMGDCLNGDLSYLVDRMEAYLNTAKSSDAEMNVSVK